jgi:hypothetical protein
MGVPRTELRKRLLAAAGALFAALLAVPAAQALSAPEVFPQEEDASNQPVGNWIPLSGASMHSVNRYLIGVRLQDTGQPGNTQRINVLVNSVPSGSPKQPDVYSLICPEVTGTAGQIVPASQNGPEDVRYQGDGTYSISVAATPAASGDIGTLWFRADDHGNVYRVGPDRAAIRRAHGDSGSEREGPVRRDRGVARVWRRRHGYHLRA